jgi:hypothetical protein
MLSFETIIFLGGEIKKIKLNNITQKSDTHIYANIAS